MPISFLTVAQRKAYGNYSASPTSDELTGSFHLNDDDLAQIALCRGNHNRLGFALQLTTVRFLGAFLDDPLAVPSLVLQTIAQQLSIKNLGVIAAYGVGDQRWVHISKIRDYF